jgi:hypothetical protein
MGSPRVASASYPRLGGGGFLSLELAIAFLGGPDTAARDAGEGGPNLGSSLRAPSP